MYPCDPRPIFVLWIKGTLFSKLPVAIKKPRLQKIMPVIRHVLLASDFPQIVPVELRHRAETGEWAADKSVRDGRAFRRRGVQIADEQADQN